MNVAYGLILAPGALTSWFLLKKRQQKYRNVFVSLLNAEQKCITMDVWNFPKLSTSPFTSNK